jgi:hypothetical protein
MAIIHALRTSDKGQVFLVAHGANDHTQNVLRTGDAPDTEMRLPLHSITLATNLQSGFTTRE